MCTVGSHCSRNKKTRKMKETNGESSTTVIRCDSETQTIISYTGVVCDVVYSVFQREIVESLIIYYRNDEI